MSDLSEIKKKISNISRCFLERNDESRYWEDRFLSGRSIPLEIKPVVIANAAK